jgi:co-chaperonin GroES (HSP10)
MSEPMPSKLPVPQGYNILCAVPEIEDKFESGIIKADKTIHNEMVLASVLFVLKVGPDAYKDRNKFSYPWCKEGDFVVVRPNSGTRIKIFGKEFRLITDDQVEATVDDPRGISRA